MKVFVVALCALLAPLPSLAGDQPASEASIHKLMEVTQSKKLVDGMMGQMDAMMQNTMRQATGGVAFSSKQQAIIDEMRQRMLAVIGEEMKWESLAPHFVELYQKTFTEQEVQGMLDFYSTPAGQAVINKMPLVMQGSMEMVQKKMVVVMPKFQQIQKDAVEKLKACPREERPAPGA